MKIIATIIAVAFLLAFDAIRLAIGWFSRAAYRTGCTVAAWGGAL